MTCCILYYRWCRTYFLQRGKTVPYLFDPDELVSSLTESESKQADARVSTSSHAINNNNNNNSSGATSTDPLLQRMELLYVTLWRGLRANVREVFATNSDVLEAGTALQVPPRYRYRH